MVIGIYVPCLGEWHRHSPRLPGVAATSQFQFKALLRPGCPSPGGINYSFLGVPRSFLEKNLSNICMDGHMWFVPRNLFSPCQWWHLVTGTDCASFYSIALEECFLYGCLPPSALANSSRIEIYFQYVKFINLINLCFFESERVK